MEKIGFKAFDAHGKLLPLKDLIDRLQKSTKNLTDQQKQDAIATIFGQEALSGMLTLIDNGPKALDELTQSYKTADGAAKEMAKTMQDNAKSSVEQMVGSLETAAIKLEEVAAPSITKIANEVQEAANKFSELSPEMQEFIIKAALGAAALGPMAKVLGTVTGGIGKLISFGGRLGITLGLVKEGTTLGGIALKGFSLAGGLAVGAAAALGIGIAGVVTHNELMSKSIDTSTEELSTWEKAVNAVTGGTIKSKAELQKAGLVYKDFGDGISDGFKEGIEKATKSYHEFEMLLTTSNLDDKISDENSKKITASINSIIEDAKQTITSRKSEVQNELSEMFKLGDGKIDENEQKVLDAAGSEADANLSKVDEIQKQISDRWTKAIQEHGKLSQEDVEQIKKGLQQIQQIKAEAAAKNDAESSYAKNEYTERLNGVSANEASGIYKDSSEQIKKKFEKERVTYKTGMDELQKEIKKYTEEGKTEEAKNAQEQFKAKDKDYKASIKKEQEYLKEMRGMLYKKNSTLEGTMNEVDGSLFSKKDLKQKSNLEAMENQYDAIAKATESGMIRVQDAAGKWHDIQVTVDQATGHITSAYDTFNGDYAGYSEKFANNAKETGDKIKEEMQSLYRAINNSSGIKLDGNKVFNAKTDELITKLDTIVEKADGAKTAVQDINGARVRLEFDKNGTLTNYKDVLAAINGQTENNPAVVKTKIEVDGSEVSTIDDTVKKLNELPPETEVNITINGEEAEMTAEEAAKKLGEIPPDTNTDVIVNTSDADSKLDTTKQKAEDVDAEQPNVDATANTSGADSNLDTTKEKANEVDSTDPSVDVSANTGTAETGLSGIIDKLKWIKDNPVQAFVNFVSGSGTGVPVGNSYTGANIGTEGLTYAHEHGWELGTGEEALYYMGGGSGILDHMSSVNEMRQEVSGQIASFMSVGINALSSALGQQNNNLSSIVNNTGQMLNNDKTYNKQMLDAQKLNAELASNMVDKMDLYDNVQFGEFQKEIESAKAATDKADNMKIEDNYWYSDSKTRLDDVESQIDSLRDKMSETEDKGYKESLEKQQKVLEKQKDSIQKEVDYYKDAAQKEIEICKENAKKQVEIADKKKEKLTKLAEATTEAIKNYLTKQKEAAEKNINDQLASLEKRYNKSIARIDKDTKRKTEEIDRRIKDLEDESTDTSREDERKASKDNINVLTTKMNNTASFADKRALALQIKDAKKELEKKEDTWNIEDQKEELEREKELLAERAENRKKSLEEQYNREKEEKEKELKNVDAYYDKLLETDALNAQARFKLLTGSNEELVALLNSYNPKWQDAGQSLANSLLTGLNSSKQSVQDEVEEMLSLRNASTGTTIQRPWGYATGTSFNNAEGLYDTNEKGYEFRSKGDVAYVSKGAGIRNHMQSVADMKAEVKSQVASQMSFFVSQMRATVEMEQANMKALLAGNLARGTSNNTIKNETNNNAPLFHAENVYLKNENDIEQLSYKLGFYSIRNRSN